MKIFFTYAVLNEVGMFPANVRNECLQAPTLEKHHIMSGPEFALEKKKKIRHATRSTVWL